MTKTYTEQVFRTTYKDDFADSDNYHRVLFNSGRALQARELTQLQTIIQKEISRFGSNVFKEGAMVNPGGIQLNNTYEFIKFQGNDAVFDTVANLAGVTLTGGTSGLKVQIFEAVAATGTDPDTLYIRYLDQTGASGTTAPRVVPGETLSNGSDINLVVQATNTTTNPALGNGSLFEVEEGSFFVKGHFVFAPKQQVIVSKYSNNANKVVGFQIHQDIVSVNDTDALYDNQGATPNKSSPGADRYRIRLGLIMRESLADPDDNFVFLSTIQDGALSEIVGTDEGYNHIRDFVAVRTNEINGNFIKKYFKTYFEPNGTNDFKLKVEGGVAYINGYRVSKDKTSTLVIPKAQDSFVVNEDQVPVDYGNYFLWNGGHGMLNFNTCEQVQLKTATNDGGTVIGTANVRAIRKSGSNYAIHIFNIKKTDNTKTLRDVRSIGSSTNANYVNLVLEGGVSVLKEPNKRSLMFDTPILRPKSFEDITLTVMDLKSVSTGGGETTKSITLTGTDLFTRVDDVIISSPTESIVSGASAGLSAGNKTLDLSGLTANTAYEIAVFVTKSNVSPSVKDLTELTVSASLDSDGNGLKYIPLGKSDIYSLISIAKEDSDGTSLGGHFYLDTGARETHYDDGRLVYKGYGLDSDNQKVFARFKHFNHQSGAFFCVNSYTNQVDYKDIPAQQLLNGTTVSLRDVIDFRPSTDGNGSFASGFIPALPEPTGLVNTDATYYMPRLDKLVLSKTGELRYLTGTSSLTPKYPSTPIDCIDLYKYSLGANTLHTKDLKSTLIPLKGYTMGDINKLEKRLDKVEELTTLSLLELSTNSLKVLDSDGNDRTKSGFFVDNFANHFYTDTKNPEHRASLDPRNKLIRPTFNENSVDLVFDSADTNQLRVVHKGDNIYLQHTEVPHVIQDVASKTININPFFIEKTIGALTISPASDNWKESKATAPKLVDGGTELDTRQALLWNNWEWNWNGVDINELQIGASSANVTGTSTTVTVNTESPRLTGTNVTETVGDWVVDGTTSTTEQLEYIDTESITNHYAKPSWAGGRIDVYHDGYMDDYWWDKSAHGGALPRRQHGAGWLDTKDIDVWRSPPFIQDGVGEGGGFKTTDTTTYNQTTRVITENEYTSDTEYTTNTSTSTTVNRIASESTVREVIGSRIVDIALIPWMRTRTISFSAEGLRPNTRYFPFFDGSNVERFCRNEDFVNFSQRNITNTRGGHEGIVANEHAPSAKHSKGTTSLITDNTGTITGSFEIPNNSAMRFRTGTREFALYDISKYNEDDTLSTAATFYHAIGALETTQDTVRSTRVLQVVGALTTTDKIDKKIYPTLSTETLVADVIAVDVKTESTITEPTGKPGPNETTLPYQPTVPVVQTEVVVEPPLVGNNVYIPGPDADLWHRNISKQSHSVYVDPLAQTFSVDDPNGIFVTRIRVYFAEKDTDNTPVWIELRPTAQGVPDGNKIIARSTKAAADVNVPNGTSIGDMRNAGTDFIFEEPVYLTGQSEFSMILRSTSMKYKVFISEVEEFLLGSTEKRVSKQPYLGSLFKSQNSKLWEPSQTQDLAFRIYRADFETSGNAILENAIVPPALLSSDPFYVENASDIVTVIVPGHGLRPGDKTRIRGIDSDTDFLNGISGNGLLGERSVLAVDGTAYTIQADQTSTKSSRFGGNQVVSSQNLVFDTLRPSIEMLQPETTNVTLSGKFTKTTSLVGAQGGAISANDKDATWSLITNNKNMNFTSPRAISAFVNETNFNAGNRTSTIQVSMTTTDRRVSPVIDLQRCGLVTIGNMIDKQDSSATVGFNVPLRYNAETRSIDGTALAKHITTPTTLEEEAVGLKVIVSANRPPSSNFSMYYKVADEGQSLVEENWILIDPENSLPSDTNKQIFREYRYIVGGEGGFMSPFTQFQVKIVMESTNSAEVPVFRDLRVIALAI